MLKAIEYDKSVKKINATDTNRELTAYVTYEIPYPVMVAVIIRLIGIS